MEALRSIEEVQLVRLLRRDDLERLFVGSPIAASDPSVTELVHLFALPRGGDTAAHAERHLEPVRIYRDLGGFGPEGPPAGTAGLGLPRVLGMGRKDPGSLFLVLEDPVGVPLPRVLVREPHWAAQAGMIWMASLCRTLEHLHRTGLGCGRILPRHLLLGAGGGAIIAEPLTLSLLHRIRGGLSFRDAAFLRLHPDPGATPPERLEGGPPTPAGDMFQAGVLVHQLLTGVAPFGEGSTLEIFNRVRSGRVANPLPEVAGPLADLARACLSPSPEDRPDAAALARALETDAPEMLPTDDVATFSYSSTFPPILELHDGEGGGGPEPAPLLQTGPAPVDRDQALAQLEILLQQAASSRPTVRRRTLPWLMGLALVLGLGFILVNFPFGGPPSSPSSRVTTDRKGRTHAPSSHGGAVPHQGRKSWHLDGLPEPLRAQLEGLGFPTRDVPLASRRVGADCEVVTVGADGLRHRFSFLKCRDLERICSLDQGACAPRPDGTVSFRVLYDPDGRPLLLQALGPKDQVLRNIEIP